MPVSKEIQAWDQEVYNETHLFITDSSPSHSLKGHLS